MKNLYKLISILLLVFFTGIFISSLKLPLTENLYIHQGRKVHPLWRGATLEQSFIPQRKDLIGIKLAFKKTNNVDHPVEINLFEKIDQDKTRTLYKGNFSSKQIQTSKNYPFMLSKPLKGQGQEYWLYFSANVASDSASISPIISQVDNYIEGQTLSSEGPLEGDVFFKPIYKVDLPHFISYYINKIVFGKATILNKFVLAGLFAFWGLLLIILLGSLFGFLENKEQKKKIILTVFLIIALSLVLFYKPTPSFVLESYPLPG